jgi:hypothetical protein
MFTDEVLSYKNSVLSGEELIRKTNTYFSDKYLNNPNPEKKFTPPFIPGEIYYFRYQTDSKISKDRPFINRIPIVLCTDVVETIKTGTLLKGIDLVVVPPRLRIDIIGKIYDSFKSQIESNDLTYGKGGKKIPIRLTSQIIDPLLEDTGYKNALFGFKYKFIRSPGVIAPLDWPKLPYLSANLIEGMPIQGIYNEYQTKLNT